MKNNSIYNDKLLIGEYYPKVIAYYLREWKNYNMSFHSHDQVEIMYVVKGQCIVETPVESFSLSKGDCIFLDACTPHGLTVSEDHPCRMINIEFGFEGIEESSFSIKNLVKVISSISNMHEKKLPYFLFKDTDEIYEPLRNIIRELDEKGSDNQYMIGFLIFQILILMGRKIKEMEREEISSVSSYIKKATKYMNENYGCEIHVEDIASFVNLHPNYLHRVFKAHTGESIMDYLQCLRIRKAEMLLAYTNVSVIDLAEELGFGSRQYFSYIFKKHKGVSPIQFRRDYSKVQFH